MSSTTSIFQGVVVVLLLLLLLLVVVVLNVELVLPVIPLIGTLSVAPASASGTLPGLPVPVPRLAKTSLVVAVFE